MKTYPEARRLIGRSRPVSGRHHCFIAVVLGSLITPAAAGQTGNSQPAGKTAVHRPLRWQELDGWKKTDFSHAGEVKVEDGAIVMRAGRPMTGITSTRKDLPRTNYELSYEAMRLAGRDFFAAATFPVGKSFITLVNGGWGGNVTGLSSLDGADASENETGSSSSTRTRPGTGSASASPSEVIRCWIDDKEIVAVDIQGPPGRHADRDPRETNPWASPPGRPAAPSATSRSGPSRPPRSRPTTS